MLPTHLAPMLLVEDVTLGILRVRPLKSQRPVCLALVEHQAWASLRNSEPRAK